MATALADRNGMKQRSRFGIFTNGAPVLPRLFPGAAAIDAFVPPPTEIPQLPQTSIFNNAVEAEQEKFKSHQDTRFKNTINEQREQLFEVYIYFDMV